MAKPKGSPKSGGRKKGTPNKSDLRDRLANLKCDHVEYLALTVLNKIPCSVCRGKGKTKFQPRDKDGPPGERTCQSCWGSKLERLAPAASQQAATTLLRYTHAELKAVEHSLEGVDGASLVSLLTARRDRLAAEQ